MNHSAGENTALLNEAARRMVSLGLETPVTFLLEAHKPLAGIAHVAALLLQPIASLAFGQSQLRSIVRLLEDPTNIERLLSLIESYSSAAKQINSK